MSVTDNASARRRRPSGHRDTQKAATRRRIAEAALRVFAEKGYRAASVSDIVRAAGVAHGTFYFHFRDMEALMAELLAEFNEGFAAWLGSIWDGAAAHGRDAQIERTAAIFLDYWESRREFIRAYAERIAAEGLSPEALRDGVNAPAAALLAERFRAIERVIGRKEPLADLVAQGLLAMWMRIGMQYLFGEGVSRERAYKALVRLTFGALDEAFLADPEETD